MQKAIYSKDHRFLVKQLQAARKTARLSQEDVANILKTTQSHVSKLESGQRRIDLVQLKQLAKIYKKPLTFFLV